MIVKMFNHTEERIKKLFIRRLSDEQIARKIGRPNDIERVKKATELLKEKEKPSPVEGKKENQK